MTPCLGPEAFPLPRDVPTIDRGCPPACVTSGMCVGTCTPYGAPADEDD